MQTFITENSKQTKQLGEMLAEEILLEKKFPKIICLSGDLGAGKTTFTQGLLKGLKIKGPYTSPTFAIMKHYQMKSKVESLKSKIRNVYHIDAYRVEENDILNLGWQEMLLEKNVIIVEWAERIAKIIPNPPAGGSVWINFEWVDEKKRKITFTIK